MAEKTGTQKGREDITSVEPPGDATNIATRSGKSGSSNRNPKTAVVSFAGADESPQSLVEAQARIAELEAELAATKTTVSALLRKAERRLTRTGMTRTGMTRSGVTKTGVTKTETVNTEKREESTQAGENRIPSDKLDMLVRTQTRALVESEAQLRRKAEDLARLNDMKVEFISIATHEMRTPLTSIVGYLDMITDQRFGELPEKMVRPVNSLRRNAMRLKRLVDEMLDVNRIDSGRITLFRTACDFAEIINKVVDDFHPQADAKGVVVKLNVEATMVVDADPSKIEQAMTKLLMSAARHIPSGGTLTITVDQEPERQFAGTWIRMRIRATGVDVGEGIGGHLFEPFSDANTARHHTSSGPDSAGLGLYIARGLIDLHGGLVSIDTDEDGSIEFTVFLPAARRPGEVPSESGR